MKRIEKLASDKEIFSPIFLCNIFITDNNANDRDNVANNTNYDNCTGHDVSNC